MTSSGYHVVRPSLIGRISQLLARRPGGELIVPSPEPVELSETVRISWQDEPFALTFGQTTLFFHPDCPASGVLTDSAREWIVHSGDAFYQDVPRYLRIAPGQTLLFGRSDKDQSDLFGYGKQVADRHFRITSHKGQLTIQPLEPDRRITLSTDGCSPPIWSVRRDNLLRLAQVLDHPLQPFNDDDALSMMQEVNDIMATEAYRERDDEGNPGGIIQFPEDKTVVMLGDVHSSVDNVLSTIAQGGMLAALERGTACLVFLGDLVHTEKSDQLEEMDSSLFILDLFCMLKRRFPENIFYIRGNHESFEADVGKGGVPQGLLLRKHLKKRRGKQYLAEVETLFNRLALIIAGKEFIACHGGPVRAKVNRNTLVNAGRYPGIQHELVWNRIRQGNRPGGYGKGSVKRFRQVLGVSKNAPVLVGHTPQSAAETAWLDVGGITGHHIIYSAHSDRAAVVVSAGGVTTMMEFVPDPALSLATQTTES